MDDVSASVSARPGTRVASVCLFLVLHGTSPTTPALMNAHGPQVCFGNARSGSAITVPPVHHNEPTRMHRAKMHHHLQIYATMYAVFEIWEAKKKSK